MNKHEAPVAIVTGGGSGIGLATALQLVEKGFVVALVGRTRETLKRTLVKVGEVGGRGLAVPADVSKVEEVNAAVQRVARECGRIDALVNNAGMAPLVPMAQLSPEQWHDILNTNLSSAFYATRAVWPIMAAQPRSELLQARGVIVNISSKASVDPFTGLGAYAVAKAGVNMLTLVTAREGREAGIRVVGVAPSAVETEMFKKVIGGKPIAPGTALQPDDVASMVVDAAIGSLRHSSGDTLFIHCQPA